MNRRHLISAGIIAFTLLPYTTRSQDVDHPLEMRFGSYLYGNAWDLLGTASEGAVEVVNVGLEDGYKVHGIIHNNSDDFVFLTNLVSADPDVPMFHGGSTVQYMIPIGGYALFSTMLQLGLELHSVDDLPELTVESVTPVQAEENFIQMYETIPLAVVDFSFSGNNATYTLQSLFDSDASSYVGLMLRFDEGGTVINYSILDDSEVIPAQSARKLKSFILYDTAPEDRFLVGFYGLVE